MESEESGKEYEFSNAIQAHRSDVKCICNSTSSYFISGSRDETIKAFSIGEIDYLEILSINARLAVNAVAYCASADYNQLIFAGLKDGSIAVFGSPDMKLIRVLHQHKLNVCALHVDDENKKLLSGSWDNNCIVWPIDKIISNSDFQAFCLVGHKMSVWAVASIPGRRDYYLTGSADLTIKFWKDDIEINSFSGHEDVVRSLLVLSENRFLSASNDCTIRLWDLDAGVCLQKYASLGGEYIYSIAHGSISGCNLIANSGEGGFLELWDLNDTGFLSHRQLIRTPAQSLWSTIFLKNGDLAVGADDGNIYVFTTAAKRKASTEALGTFHHAVSEKIANFEATLAAQQNEIVTIKVALDDGQPNIELRYKKGSDPFQAAQTFLLENNLPASYLNEVAEYIIDNIPEARQAALKNLFQSPLIKKTVLDGKEWDYVFEVTTDDGRILKLPYNIGEDTNFAAQRFIEKNNLPIKFLEKVSTLLKFQVPGASSSSNGTKRSGNFMDPLTGNRYTPGVSSENQAFSRQGFVADPLTGGNAYVSSPPGKIPNTILSLDKRRPRSELVPLANFYHFGIEQSSAKAIVKLRELNEKQVAHKLNSEQLSALEDIMKSSTYEPRDIHVSAIDVGFQWDIDTIVPIMDIFRISLLNQTLNRIYCALKAEDERPARGLETMQRLSSYLISANSDPIRILACRALANAAMHQWGREMLIHDGSSTIAAVVAQLKTSKPALQLAATTALANWALILLHHTESGEVAELGPREDFLRTIIQVIEEITCFSGYNQIALIRLLQAIATLMWGDIAVIKLAKGRNIIGIVNRIKDVVVDESGKALARDVAEMAYSL